MELVFEKVVFDAADGNGAKIAGRYYPSACEDIKGVVQICHGMAEHLGRYEEFIAFLNKAGYHVCGIDMLGHGLTYELNRDLGYPLGYFGEGKSAADDTVRDIMEMHRLSRVRFGENIPYIFYGHSLGSFIARYIYSKPEFSCGFKKYVLSSTGGPNYAVGLGKLMAGAACLFGRAKKEGRLINKIAFAGYLKRINKPNSKFDWISSDPEEVRTYLKDPMCGFVFTNEGFAVMLRYVGFVQSRKAYQNLSEAPCFFAYGSEDPVGGYARGVGKVIINMKKHGRGVLAKCYVPYRHEIQHEPVREEYFRDIVDFLDK